MTLSSCLNREDTIVDVIIIGIFTAVLQVVLQLLHRTAAQTGAVSQWTLPVYPWIFLVFNEQLGYPWILFLNNNVYMDNA